ncbi:F-box/FBD/LRR-repeat protein At1g13570-like isoform X1 [Solanum stenotomum]|uniref:F-box/FBD/LRR-repeat protein At1g13570-like isoform X1 n=1 Tax=Solanum stenotomum TaxID=172797 RepID=UPI0020D11105|nr:F-box/FBD/LRR-repeat protein At1g13570-like isoform X1 [Solanum stenotomum]XP_049398304.1 F-box/FBD/LRR-repeat protein At1g13570-like isoform X1 [Solanum stenotomum]
MNQDRVSVAVEGDIEDRISVLPRNVIDCILELLPVKEAAKTCTLSKSWRYIWSELPKMVLDYEFCDELIDESESKFREVVDGIMLLHMGKIVKFDLDVRVDDLASYTAIDRWVLYVTRNSVKKLHLRISNIDDRTYTLPPCVFHCSTLTQLKLARCSFKPPGSFRGFPNLVTLRLASVTFSEHCVIKAPLLANLTLNCCDGMQYLNIVSPVLKSLYVCYPHSYIALNCFMNCKNLRDLGLVFSKVVDNPKHDHRSTLVKLLGSLPALEVLLLDSLFIELLSADVVLSRGPPFMLNCLRKLSLSVDFGKLGHISCVLQLIKCSPNLSELEITVKGIDDNVEAFVKCLKTPGCLQLPLNKLEYVSFYGFASPNCVEAFAMLFIFQAPSLLRIFIEQPIGTKSSKELSGLPRASPKAELVIS